MRWIPYIICSVSLVLSAGSAAAQPSDNSQEVEAAAGFFHTQDADTGSLNADLSYGRYLGDMASEAGVRIGYAGVYNDNAPDVWTARVTPFYDYHFTGVTPDDRVLPFVGGFIGAIFNDDDGDGTLGPELGAKFFFNKQTYAGVRYRYEWFFDDLDVGTESSEGNHVVTFALGYVWNG